MEREYHMTQASALRIEDALQLLDQADFFNEILDQETDIDAAMKMLTKGNASLKGSLNYTARRDITDIDMKPYRNRDGNQQPWGEICRTDPEWAAEEINRNMNKFQGGLKNWTAAEKHLRSITAK